MALTAQQQSRMDAAKAAQETGRVGFHAAIMEAGGNGQCRALGILADGELRAQDRAIRGLTWERDNLLADVARLKAEIARMKGGKQQCDTNT